MSSNLYDINYLDKLLLKFIYFIDTSEKVTGEASYYVGRTSHANEESEAGENLVERNDITDDIADYSCNVGHVQDSDITSNNTDTDSSCQDENYIPTTEESESDDNEDPQRYREVQELRQWAQSTKIPLAHLSSLLGILRQRVMPLLPKAAKTFLNTNGVRYNIRSFGVIDNLDGGEQAYLGIAVFLRQIINIRLHNERVLDLLFNIDGLPLYKSSSKQFWPILCKVFFDPDIYEPFPVAIYAGKLL